MEKKMEDEMEFKCLNSNQGSSSLSTALRAMAQIDRLRIWGMGVGLG